MERPSLRRHTNWELELTLEKEEAMALRERMPWYDKTAVVQVSVRYKDQNGAYYAAIRTIKMRVKRVTDS